MILTENAAVLSKFSAFFTLAKKVRETEDPRLKKLKEELYHSKLELEAAMDNFNNVTDPKLVDVYIYKMRSEETRYEKILSEIKQLM